MTNISKANTDFDSSNLIVFIWKWRIPIIVILGIAILASVILSSPWFITPKFKSMVVLFPTSTNSISKVLLSENYAGKGDIMEFGEEEQAEQLLQILNSNQIRSRIIDKYDLLQHYDIDSNSRYKFTNLYKEYESNIKFRRTEFMAVEITVMDKDPQMAADIANDIAELLDSTKNKMQKERAHRAYEIVKLEYEQLRSEIKDMEDSLTKLRELGVHDYESQAEMINQQYAIELAKGNAGYTKRLEDNLKTLAKYGGAYVSIRDALEHEKKLLSHIKSKYEEAKVDAEEYIPQKFVVDVAYKAEKKSYPVRWLIVAVASISSFILSVLLFILIEQLIKAGIIHKKEK